MAYLGVHTSPSRASFKTFDDSTAPTPMRADSPAPARDVNERSRLLDRSDVFVDYNSEQAERVERRKRPSAYTVINNGTTSGVDSVGVSGSNGDDDDDEDGDDGEFPVSCLSCPVAVCSRSKFGIRIVGLPKRSKSKASNWRKRLSYYVPVTAWIPGYSWSLYVSHHFYPLCPFHAVERTG
jgi:hypothetical protein